MTSDDYQQLEKELNALCIKYGVRIGYYPGYGLAMVKSKDPLQKWTLDKVLLVDETVED